MKAVLPEGVELIVSGRRDGVAFEYMVRGAVDKAKWAETTRIYGWRDDRVQKMTFQLHPRYPFALGMYAWDEPSAWPTLFYVDRNTYSMWSLTLAGLAAVEQAKAAAR